MKILKKVSSVIYHKNNIFSSHSINYSINNYIHFQNYQFSVSKNKSNKEMYKLFRDFTDEKDLKFIDKNDVNSTKINITTENNINKEYKSPTIIQVQIDDNSTSIIEQPVDYSLNKKRTGRNISKKRIDKVPTGEVSLNLSEGYIADKEMHNQTILERASKEDEDEDSSISDLVVENRLTNSNRFSDKCKIYFKAGNGGSGSNAFYKGSLGDQSKIIILKINIWIIILNY